MNDISVREIKCCDIMSTTKIIIFLIEKKLFSTLSLHVQGPVIEII